MAAGSLRMAHPVVLALAAAGGAGVAVAHPTVTVPGWWAVASAAGLGVGSWVALRVGSGASARRPSVPAAPCPCRPAVWAGRVGVYAAVVLLTLGLGQRSMDGLRAEPEVG